MKAGVLLLLQIISLVKCEENNNATSKPLSVLLVTGLYPGHRFPLVSLGEELVRRGHNVTLCANVMRGSHLYPDVPERVGIKFVSAGYDPLSQEEYEEISAVMQRGLLLNSSVANQVANMGQASYIQIRDKVEEIGMEKFDVLVGEVSAYVVAAYFHKKGMKSIGLSTIMMLSSTLLPSWPTPMFSTVQSDNLSFQERLTNVMLFPFVEYLIKLFSSVPDAFKDVLTNEDIRRVHMPVIYTTVYGFDYPKTRYPLMEYVGPVLMNSLPQLDESLQEWLDSSQGESVIYISMGTTGLLSVETATAILEGVMATPYHAVWAMKKKNRKLLGEVDFEAYQDRLYLAEWVPQQTVLQHRAILMTILHCGLNGVQESLYNSLPVICVPYAFDQFEVGSKLSAAGAGVSLNSATAKPETITDSIHRIVSDNYAENASRISRMYKFAGGAKRAADLVEFYEDVGYEHLVPSFVKYKWSWVQYYNVDVWLVMMVTCGVLGWLVWRIVLKCAAMCPCKLILA